MDTTSLILSLPCAHYPEDDFNVYDLGLDSLELGIIDHTMDYVTEANFILDRGSAKKLVNVLCEKFNL